MAKQRLLLFTVVVVTFVTFELMHAAPLSLQDQYQAALQQVAVLNGNGTFQDCCDIREAMKDVFGEDQPESGIFNIPDACGAQANTFFGGNLPNTQASCDFKNGGGWVVILRRNASLTHENFSRSWDEYERGFGDLNGEFWYGLRNIHCLTTREDVELQIEVRLSDGSGQVWSYGQFVVDGPEFNYTLHIGQAVGPSYGVDSMANHNGMQFSTTDRDNDKHALNCANHYYKAGWWYKRCYYSILTGRHGRPGRLYWGYRTSPSSTSTRHYPFAEMKVRPKSCTVAESCN